MVRHPIVIPPFVLHKYQAMFVVYKCYVSRLGNVRGREKAERSTLKPCTRCVPGIMLRVLWACASF